MYNNLYRENNSRLKNTHRRFDYGSKFKLEQSMDGQNLSTRPTSTITESQYILIEIRGKEIYFKFLWNSLEGLPPLLEY